MYVYIYIYIYVWPPATLRSTLRFSEPCCFDLRPARRTGAAPFRAEGS